MAKRNLPAFILKNCSLAIDGNTRIGQCNSITIPVLERTMEEFRNAGMIKPREVAMGYEVTTTTFKETAFDPTVMSLYGIMGGSNRNLVAYGYLESEKGDEHKARFEMVADFKKIDGGEWSPGEKAESEYELGCTRLCRLLRKRRWISRTLSRTLPRLWTSLTAQKE